MRPIATEQNLLEFPLNQILGTAAHVRLLRILAEEVVGPIASPEAAERTGLTEAGARRALNRLSKTGFVRRVGGGRSQQYALREDDPITLQLTLLFRKERERFDELISTIRGCFESLHEVQYAWIDTLPQEIGKPLELSFVGDSGSLSWLREEVQRRVLTAEKEFDLMVEVHAFSQADAPDRSPDDPILLAGVLPETARRRPDVPRTHSEREERALRLSRGIAELLEKNPSLIRRAIHHLERVLQDDPGAASHDLEEWKAILTGYSVERVKEFLVGQSSRAERLRQSSPFFAVLSADERDRVLGLMETGR